MTRLIRISIFFSVLTMFSGLGCSPDAQDEFERSWAALHKASDVGLSFRTEPELIDSNIPKKLSAEFKKIEWEGEEESYPYITKCVSHNPPQGRHGELYELLFFYKTPSCMDSEIPNFIVKIKYNKFKDGFSFVSWRAPKESSKERTNSLCSCHYDDQGSESGRKPK